LPAKFRKIGNLEEKRGGRTNAMVVGQPGRGITVNATGKKGFENGGNGQRPWEESRYATRAAFKGKGGKGPFCEA